MQSHRVPVPKPSRLTKNSMPTRPKMMEGMPASVSAANPMTAATLRLAAYSVR